MATVFFSERDYRKTMRDKYGADRAHAVCRKLLGVSGQRTYMYGATYWAACCLLSHPDVDRNRIQNLKFYKDTWLREVEFGSKITKKQALVLWRWALSKVEQVKVEALALEHSMFW